jgi:methylmalonyl-CoA/ethylmalonyl-CoA epimerase
MFQRVHHLGLAVRDVDAAAAFYQQTFGVAEWEFIDMPERHMRVAAASLNGTMIEIIAPTSDEAAFAKYLSEKGQGMHHVAYQVDDIHAALAELKARGVQLIDQEPRPGLHGTLVAFIHPKATLGTLIELVQDAHR